MRILKIATIVVALSVFPLVQVGCSSTDSPGTKYVVGSYSSMLDSSPDKVTKAARKAVEELKFTDVSSTATKIDGKVMAKTAQDDTVRIDVEQAGDNVSKVSIRVGVGDEATSRVIMDKIKDNLHWF